MNSERESDNGLRDILISHFDDEALKSSTVDQLKIFGPKENNEFLRAPYQYVENNLLNNIGKKKILDYCCGTGVYSVFPAQNNASVYGIDISDKSIKIAKKRADILNISNSCKFNVSDAENLDFEDNFFDIAVSYGSLSYLDLKSSFKELKRVLKPEGILIIVDTLGHNPIFNYNRRKNIRNYAPNYVGSLKTLKHKDLEIALNYFNSHTIKYFDFFTLLGNMLDDKYKYKIEPIKLMKLDNYFLSLPLINRLSFKFVCVIT